MLALRIQGLRKEYGPVVAVEHLDLEVRAGECFGLLGPNGAGKTTTIEICEGLTEPTAGSVQLFGLSWARNAAEIRERIGISLQETQLADKATVEESVRLFRSFYRNRRPVDEVLNAVQLGEKRTARVGTLSGGQKQRLALACALVGTPDLFFLDEPTTGLDPQSRRQLWELIIGFKAAGRTVVLTTHYMDEAEKLCDRIAIVDQGRVIALGTPRDLIRSLGADHVVEFATGTAPADDMASRLGALPGVSAVHRDAERWRLSVSQLHRTVPALLAFVEQQGSALTELSTHTTTLEDLFVALTGRHLRDA